jgi:hypothetical protein
MVKLFSKNAAVGGMAPQRAQPGLALIGLACGLCLAMAAAQAENFTFSFSEDLALGAAGTVNGEIFGLNSSGTSSATQLEITGTSPVLGGLSPFPILFDPSGINTFTVSGGTISAADFASIAIGNSNVQLAINDNGGLNQLESFPYAAIVNQNGMAGISFTSLSAPVPELPVPLMLSFATLLPLLARRMRQAQTSAA